jgi:DNA-binding NarL/FixJ family response regulator
MNNIDISPVNKRLSGKSYENKMMEKQPIKILIADDHAVVRKGIRALIELQPEMVVVGESSNGREAITKAAVLQPDVILMDLNMPHTNGVEAIEEIKSSMPEIGVLVLTMFSEDDQVVAAVNAGANGFVLKNANPSEIIRAIREISRGESPFTPAVGRILLGKFRQKQVPEKQKSPLTDRETEVLILLARGLTTKHIARELFISERTVGTHISNILNKLQLENRIQAALYALRNGLAEL